LWIFFACSGPNDHVFVYFTDHGAPGLIAFPESEVSLINSQASAGFLVSLLFCEQTHKQEYNSCTICTEACANVAGVTQIIFHNNNCKRWNVQHVLSIGQRKNPSPWWNFKPITSQIPVRNPSTVYYLERLVVSSLSHLLGSFMWHPTSC